MGMDYFFNGSASYPRFNKELTAIVALFGGYVLEELKKQQEAVPEGSIDWWFGKPMNEADEKFIFKEEVPEAFKKWANHPYDDFTLEETEEIFNLLRTKEDEVNAISEQMYHEFEMLIDCSCAWSIC